MIAEVYQLATPILFSGLLFFLHRLLKNFDKLAEKSEVVSSDLVLLKDRLSTLDRLSERLQQVREEFGQMKADLQTALIAAAKVRNLEDELAVMKRDQTSIWKRIDEVKDGLSDVRRLGKTCD